MNGVTHNNNKPSIYESVQEVEFPAAGMIKQLSEILKYSKNYNYFKVSDMVMVKLKILFIVDIGLSTLLKILTNIREEK